MSAPFRFVLAPSAAAVSLAVAALQVHAQTATPPAAAEAAATLPEVKVLGTAEEELRQAPGVSTITEEDLQRRPPANDLSQIIRTMPGVNLTGNSASGQYGNHRQIDLRGMGPENTLILIDGKPVHSRDSIRMGRSGERNTRGDTNWVPAETIERIEVLRGPAAARYGSGAAGGVVNIITKAPSKALTGSVSAYVGVPEHSDEGGSRRLGFSLAGPVAEGLSFRLYGNVAKTEADDLDLNRSAAPPTEEEGAIPPAGREGVRNRDIDGLLRWDLLPGQVLEFGAGFSRQGNIYAGDRAVSSTGTPLQGELAASGAETNVMIRRTASVTHRGRWDFGSSKIVLQYEGTDNTRLNEGLGGSTEGGINTAEDRSTSELENWFLNGEVNVPLSLGGFDQVLTAGLEFRKEKLNDPYSVTQSTDNGGVPPGLDAERDGHADADTFALFLEDNIELRSDLILTPGLRFDDHSQFGSNWSPSLNASYELTPEITIKGGVARAFKAPNLYQSNGNYLYYTMGNGCPVDFPSLGAGCYVQGNPELKAETSLNTELGIAYASGRWNAGLTYFHNNYRNKIVAGMEPVDTTAANGRVFQWTNAPKAVVQGFEGHVALPLARTVTLSNNLTYMIENKNKQTGEPLSVIPRYTINSTLDWQATQRLSLVATATYYGRQKPRRTTTTGADAVDAALDERGSYGLYGVNLGYDLGAGTRLRVGIDNLFDKRLFREGNSSGVGADTYNEPGRLYYASLTASF